ncbi:MAG: hypothetical protein Q7K21_07485 [Elusimicrobiota bacterium]|nr:hypothetical protein [Elusimicrobiota bacterium]
MKKIISILVLAFVLRIGFILTLEPRPYYPDETVFIQIASNIAS